MLYGFIQSCPRGINKLDFFEANRVWILEDFSHYRIRYMYRGTVRWEPPSFVFCGPFVAWPMRGPSALWAFSLVGPWAYTKPLAGCGFFGPTSGWPTILRSRLRFPEPDFWPTSHPTSATCALDGQVPKQQACWGNPVLYSFTLQSSERIVSGCAQSWQQDAKRTMPDRTSGTATKTRIVGAHLKSMHRMNWTYPQFETTG